MSTTGARRCCSIYGGKLTTYRRLSEDVLDMLAARLGWSRQHWTAGAALPGGDIAGADFGAFLDELRKVHSRLPAALLGRLAAAYGTRVDRTGGRGSIDRGAGRGSVARTAPAGNRVPAQRGWAVTAEDILYRRSKLALHLPADAAERLDDWLARHPRAESPGPALV